MASITTYGLPPRIEEILATNGEDLPILRQSCKSILECTDRENSNASDVSQVVMRDQALMTKVIKLANSVVYATMTSVTTAFQAVRIVGFDVIRAIAIGAELVEQADERGGNSRELKRLLAQALVSATAAMELEEASRHKNSNLFTSTMLYTLGDLVLAHYVPDVYHRLEVARQTDPTNVSALEKEVLGIPLKGLATIISKEWGLPANIIQVIQATPPPMGKMWGNPQEKLVGIVYSANELGRCWLSPPSPFNQSTMRKLIEKIPQSLALPPQAMKTIILNTFTKAAQFAEAVNIERKFFLPHSQWGKLPPPNPYVGLMTDIAKVTKVLKQRVEKHGLPPLSHEIEASSAASVAPLPRQDLFVWLQEFSLQALGTQDANRILHLGAEGLHKAGQFERVALVLLSPETGMLEPRTGLGAGVKELLPLFRCPLHSQHLLATAFKGYEPRKIDDLKAEVQMGRLSETFLNQWGETTCLIGPLIAKAKPVGVIVADRGITKTPITENDYSTFMMVLAQINMNLTRLATGSHSN
ncbi:HDOD domain-containing protein [Candidatus Nitronereus thalassa]|uniref:HDOD domain-containing protein n=1 Tax=Candidatus Nitronereus thalassa TaxID=3020898 RepID=A0ABU3K527_9BACT|nr:HDOD domain-containing protein [Candidatus Nitronereus thalassa]MDT7041501.1 HDOD domain-containing protein [Candidatus Nitronereus thalassa]